MQIEFIKQQVQVGQFRLSIHAEIRQIVDAILNDEILENYSDTGRGESCLILGFTSGTPLHIVCGNRGDLVIIVTVYIPGLPKFSDPWTRASAE